jgi:hypothetical protein
LLALAPDPTDSGTVRSATRHEIVSALEAALTAWRGRPELRAYDPRIAAELTFALVEAALTRCFVHGDGSREEEYLRETIACIEGALLSRPSSNPQPRSSP